MINVSETAASKISELLTEENKSGSGLRVFVQGGGCSGFQYGLMIEENVVASAGTVYYLSLEQIKDAIREAGYVPRQRNVFYELIDEEVGIQSRRSGEGCRTLHHDGSPWRCSRPFASNRSTSFS